MEAIGNLTGGVAHDFNNLLGIIIGNLDLLTERQAVDPELGQLTREALDAALRGAGLTQRLLAFARRQPLQPKRIELNEIVARISKLLGRTLGEDIEVTLDLADGVWPHREIEKSRAEDGLEGVAPESQGGRRRRCSHSNSRTDVTTFCL
jgi:signal transduction histidine kinase